MQNLLSYRQREMQPSGYQSRAKSRIRIPKWHSEEMKIYLLNYATSGIIVTLLYRVLQKLDYLDRTVAIYSHNYRREK